MFQFAHPVGGATETWRRSSSMLRFQFAHPVGGATFPISVFRKLFASFNSRTP